jgi:glutamate-1-semialdehyde 2,1-aminomutase
MFKAGQKNMPGGVPMSWMAKWPGAYPVFVEKAKGARFTDVDGNTYIDFCLGDTGSMTGHSPDATVAAIREQAGKGITAMFRLQMLQLFLPNFLVALVFRCGSSRCRQLMPTVT